MKEDDKRPLTKELHQLLINKGYKYFMIEDVGFAKDGNTMISCTVKPAKYFPHSFYKSYTGIEDGMITALIDGHQHISIFIELDGELN
jgi:hypothetical protein